MASVAQQMQAQGLSLLNMENKLRQQPKIAHEHGAGSQCLKCGPKCSGFDLHFWRKICKNCRCVKEDHLVPEDDVASRVVGQLFDNNAFNEKQSAQQQTNHDRPLKLSIGPAMPSVAGEPVSPLDWVPPTADVHLALKYMEQLPADQQPIVGSQAAVERKRALERQLPSHDLDPERCQSLSSNEKQMMKDYVRQMKQHVVGQGLIQVCPPRGKLPPPPPQLDRILEQKVGQITLQPAQAKSPAVSPKPSRPLAHFSPKPFVRFEDTPSVNEIRKMSSKPHGGDSYDLPPPPPEMLQDSRKMPTSSASQMQDNLPPPPPPDMLQNTQAISPIPVSQTPSVPPPPLPSTAPANDVVVGEQSKPYDPVREFFDFLDEQEGKKLPGKLKSPFLHQQAASGNFHVSPRPFQQESVASSRSPVSSPLSSKKIPGQRPAVPLGGRVAASQHIHQAAPPPAPHPQPQQKQQQTRIDQAPSKQLMVTDFDYLPANDNETNVNKVNNNPPIAPTTNNNNVPPVKKEVPQQQLHQHKVSETPQGPVKYDQEIFELAEQQWHCHKCRDPVQPGTVAVFAERAGSDQCWHPQCFCCSICNERLADLIYFFVDGELFCGRHYSEKVNIPRCKACDELIFATEYTQAEGASWHMNHFCCWLCDTPLAGKQYTPVDEQPHCLDCYQKKYGKNCHECKKPILATERLVSHADWAWHDSPNCFKCRQCKTSMIDRQFVWKNEQVYCSRDCYVQHTQENSQQQAKVILIP